MLSRILILLYLNPCFLLLPSERSFSYNCLRGFTETKKPRTQGVRRPYYRHWHTGSYVILRMVPQNKVYIVVYLGRGGVTWQCNGHILHWYCVLKARDTKSTLPPRFCDILALHHAAHLSPLLILRLARIAQVLIASPRRCCFLILLEHKYRVCPGLPNKSGCRAHLHVHAEHVYIAE